MILSGTINHTPYYDVIPIQDLKSIIIDARGGDGGCGGNGGHGGNGFPGIDGMNATRSSPGTNGSNGGNGGRGGHGTSGSNGGNGGTVILSVREYDMDLLIFVQHILVNGGIGG